jgi:D-tyrosyl-tRNA(Tyr) deacylase
MRAVVLRVSRARVSVDGDSVAVIRHGAVILVGVARDDAPSTAFALAARIAAARFLEGPDGMLRLSLREAGAAALAVSQITLCGHVAASGRISFDHAATPEAGREAFEAFVSALRSDGIHVETGRFGARMEVELVNDGPVTLVFDELRRDPRDASATSQAPS